MLAVTLATAWMARAADPSIQTRAAEIVINDEGVLLDTAFDVELGPTLEDALQRGVALDFVLEFSLTHARWWTFGLWDRTVHAFELRQRLSWNALTRQYRLSGETGPRQFDSLAEATAQLGRIRGRRLMGREDLEAERPHTAAVRLQLDTSLLPKPFQITALGSKRWNLASDEFLWTVRR
ncbi:MAG: DUF4390 domain-containing protein [Burkholderiales bacterium]|nr:DUF4390 domain-containing protein [Burkholderiales bacterium]